MSKFLIWICVYIVYMWIGKNQYKENLYIKIFKTIKKIINPMSNNIWYMYNILNIVTLGVLLVAKMEEYQMLLDLDMLFEGVIVGTFIWLVHIKFKICEIKFSSEKKLELFWQTILLFSYAYLEELLFRLYGNMVLGQLNWYFKQIILGMLFCGIHYFSDISQINKEKKYIFPLNVNIYVKHVAYEFLMHSFLAMMFIVSNNFNFIVMIHFTHNFIYNVTEIRKGE